ncbi:MAG TPA: YHYH protein [Chthoniobacteraceae bacterium]|jgi:hypothetical protein
MNFRPLLAFVLLSATALADPRLSSWLTDASTKYARIYTTDANKLNGTSVTTWANGSQGQATPAYCGVQEVSYSTSWVYVRSTGLGSHIMGPWYDNAARTIAFVNIPKNQKDLFRIPRTPVVPTTKTRVQGEIGWFVDGVHAFDATDAVSYSNASARDGDAPGMPNGVTGDGVWNRDAYVNEAITFDSALAHQQNTGVYHYHANPIGPRYLLGDSVDFNENTKAYSEDPSSPNGHSPIVGWAKDGFPIYGPYGYSSALNASSSVRRMVTGFVPRDGLNGTTNLATTGRTTVPEWAKRVYAYTSTTLASSKYGPAVSTTFPLGRYIEDNDYLGDLGKVQGTDFDLDQYNGRLCVTPEYPGGTYAYFVAISATGSSLYPYNVGKQYYGTPTGAIVTSVAETVTTAFKGGPDTQEVASIDSVNPSTGNVALVWTSVEGGTYKVEASLEQASGSADLVTWTTLNASVAATSNATTTFLVDNGAALADSTRFYRTIRTALATYDPVTGTTTGGSTEGISSVSPTSGSRGATVTVTATLNSAYTPPPPPNTVAPSAATLTKTGATTITATSRTRDASTGVVTLVFAIPAAATTGAYTVNVTFGPNTFSLTNGFTVN